MSPSSPDGPLDHLLGDGPSWILGACLTGMGAVIGLLLAVLLVFSEGEETVALRVSPGEEVLPVSVRAPVSGVIDAVYAQDGSAVRVGAPLLRLKLGGPSAGDERFMDVPSPIAGTVSFARAVSNGDSPGYGDVLMTVVPVTRSLRVVGYTNATTAQRLRERQDVRLNLSSGAREAPRDGSVAGISSVPVDGLFRVSIVFPTAPPRDLLRADRKEWTAIVVLRKRSLVERATGLLRRFTSFSTEH